MVNICVCGGCRNSSPGHRVHCFPKNRETFQAWVNFVQKTRSDFTAEYVNKNSVICGSHFTRESYEPGHLMEFENDSRCQGQVRLRVDAVPSEHSSPQEHEGASSGGGNIMGVSGDVGVLSPAQKIDLLKDLESLIDYAVKRGWFGDVITEDLRNFVCKYIVLKLLQLMFPMFEPYLRKDSLLEFLEKLVAHAQKLEENAYKSDSRIVKYFINFSLEIFIIRMRVEGTELQLGIPSSELPQGIGQLPMAPGQPPAMNQFDQMGMQGLLPRPQPQMPMGSPLSQMDWGGQMMGQPNVPQMQNQYLQSGQFPEPGTGLNTGPVGMGQSGPQPGLHQVQMSNPASMPVGSPAGQAGSLVSGLVGPGGPSGSSIGCMMPGNVPEGGANSGLVLSLTTIPHPTMPAHPGSQMPQPHTPHPVSMPPLVWFWVPQPLQQQQQQQQQMPIAQPMGTGMGVEKTNQRQQQTLGGGASAGHQQGGLTASLPSMQNANIPAQYPRTPVKPVKKEEYLSESCQSEPMETSCAAGEEKKPEMDWGGQMMGQPNVPQMQNQYLQSGQFPEPGTGLNTGTVGMGQSGPQPGLHQVQMSNPASMPVGGPAGPAGGLVSELLGPGGPSGSPIGCMMPGNIMGVSGGVGVLSPAQKIDLLQDLESLIDYAVKRGWFGDVITEDLRNFVCNYIVLKVWQIIYPMLEPDLCKNWLLEKHLLEILVADAQKLEENAYESTSGIVEYFFYFSEEIFIIRMELGIPSSELPQGIGQLPMAPGQPPTMNQFDQMGMQGLVPRPQPQMPMGSPLSQMDWGGQMMGQPNVPQMQNQYLQSGQFPEPGTGLNTGTVGMGQSGPQPGLHQVQMSNPASMPVGSPAGQAGGLVSGLVGPGGPSGNPIGSMMPGNVPEGGADSGLVLSLTTTPHPTMPAHPGSQMPQPHTPHPVSMPPLVWFWVPQPLQQQQQQQQQTPIAQPMGTGMGVEKTNQRQQQTLGGGSSAGHQQGGLTASLPSMQNAHIPAQYPRTPVKKEEYLTESCQSEPMEASCAVGEEKKPELKTEPKEEGTNDKANANVSPVAEKKKKRIIEPEKLRQALMPTWDALYGQDPESLSFRQPVDRPDYFDIVKNPMDLSTIKRKLDSGKYQDPWQYVDDVWLMFNNARLYNRKTSSVYKYCSKLAEVFEAKIDPVMQGLGYCCGRKRHFSPQTLRCYGKQLCTILPDAAYFSYQNRYHFCETCFNKIQAESVSLGDDPSQPQTSINKDQFQRKKNALDPELLVECTDCGRKMHQICVLHNDTIWPEGFVCDGCQKPNKSRKENKYTAKQLPQTKLGSFLERWVNNYLTRQNHNAGKVTVRVVHVSNKEVEVKPGMKARFVDSGEMAKSFPYRSKALFAYQEIDGVDVCFFGMHVQEYGSDCLPPNQRRVYISYLDSVHFFQPRSLRKGVYHEILIGYLEYVKSLGFTTGHIWACPPSKGDNYVFHCHPEDQKIPTPKRLQDWYKEMLVKAKTARIVHDYKDIFEQATKDQLTSAKELPYFEGDFLPIKLEDHIKELEDIKMKENRKSINATKAKKKNAKKNSKKTSKNKSNLSSVNKKKPGMPNVSKDLFKKLYATMKKHKEGLFVIHLIDDPTVNTLLPITDPDPLMPCNLMDGRDAFLMLASDKHLEFSSLRHSKWSSMCMLVELHNQSQDHAVSALQNITICKV